VSNVSFSTPDPITSQLAVRQAMAYCTNKLDLLKAAYPLNSDADNAQLVMNSWIPSKHWAYAGDANITVYPFDATKGGAVLDAAGWTLAKDATYRADKDGNSLSLRITTTNSAFREAWVAVWVSQMANCGIEIIPLFAPASWWFGSSTGLDRRDFQLAAYAWVGASDPAGQTLYACDQIPTAENNWQGQNYMGWCNQTASDAIKVANNSLVRADRIKAYATNQAEFTKDVPTIPLFQRADVYAYNPNLTGFAPKVNGDGFYTYNIGDWTLPGKDTIVFGTTQEPDTLFTLDSSAQTERLVAVDLEGLFTLGENFDYLPEQQTPLSTIEAGLAKNNDIVVHDGDKIMDASGTPVDAKAGAGIKVLDNTGATVDYKDGVKMKQLVVTYKFISGMKFSDGNPVTKADWQLGYQITCDRTSGSISYITCDQTAKVDFTDDTSYVVTWKPGYQGATYYVAPYGFYDSQLKLSDGRLLKDVPAKDWNSLKEISIMGLEANVGPYMVKDWVKGQKITLVPNPNWYGGTPKTPNIVISICADSASCEAQLLGGQVDVVDSLSITSLDQTLADAATKGTIKTLISPQATWEHIDINMWLR
jgi:ABC-type transport system substrate-binding protein